MSCILRKTCRFADELATRKEFCRRFICSSVSLALNAGADKGVDNVSLEEEVDNNNRQRSQGSGGHEGTEPAACFVIGKLAKRNRQGSGRRRAHYEQRPEIQVPRIDNGQNRDGGNCALAKPDHYVSEYPERAGALQMSHLVIGARNIAHVLIEEEEDGCVGCVGKDNAPPCVDRP